MEVGRHSGRAAKALIAGFLNWRTTLILAAFVLQLVLMWNHAKRTGQDVWLTIRASVLLVIGLAIIFVREQSGDLPRWLELGLLVLVGIILAFALWFLFVQSKAHLQNIGLVAKKK